MTRSVRDPSLGPPANPDDEIVVEIIFCCPLPMVSTARPRRGDASRRSPESDSTPAKKVPSPLSKGDKKSNTGREHDRKHSSAPAGGELDAASPLDLAGSSVHTLNSAKTSPTTPSPRAFEPSTPKAMILGPDYGSFLSTSSDPLSRLRFEPLNSALVAADKAAAQIDRPRSAVW